METIDFSGISALWEIILVISGVSSLLSLIWLFILKNDKIKNKIFVIVIAVISTPVFLYELISHLK